MVLWKPFNRFEHVDAIRIFDMGNEPCKFLPHGVINADWGIHTTFAFDFFIGFTEGQLQFWVDIKSLVDPTL